MDVSSYENCTIVHDLNQDVPPELHGQFDFIFDGGTSEHVFNFPKVLENCYKMLRPGGRIFHVLPATNHVDHGFYMFSPTVFWDYYTCNRWEIVEALFSRYTRRPDHDLWDIYAYTPGCLDKFSFGRLERGLYANMFIVKKTDGSTFNAPVQQGLFLRMWDPGPSGDRVKMPLAAQKGISCLLPEGFKARLRVWKQMVRSYIPVHFDLKRIARY